MTMYGRGFLTIWSDVPAEKETDYIHWLTREHTSERVGTEGFMAVRVFRALAPDVCRYLISYELETADTVSGPDYVARLNNPTPWTQRTLPILSNFVRGGGRVTHVAGIGQGGFVTAITISGQLPKNAKDIVERLSECDRVAAVRLLETDQEKTAVKTNEKKLRRIAPGSDDRTYSAVLFIEGMDERAINGALEKFSALAPGLTAASSVGASLYVSIFTLEKRYLKNTGMR